EALVVATLAVGAEWVLGTLGWWSVAVGNLVAVVAMGWQVWRTHPGLQHRLLREPMHVRVQSPGRPRTGVRSRSRIPGARGPARISPRSRPRGPRSRPSPGPARPLSP